MNELSMAWKNLWRNKRRTIITVASIFFGVVLSTVMSSLQDGTYSNMIKMSVKLSSGYIQVQHPKFHEKKSINTIFSPTDTFISSIEEVKTVKTITKRLESFALFSSETNTRGGAVIGIEPSKDKETSNIQHWVSEGTFLEKGDTGILLTKNTAKNLKVGVKDTVVLISQGYHGVSAAAKYPVKGIITFSTPQMNNLGAFVDLKLAQQFFSAEDKISSIMIMVDDYNSVPSTVQQIKDLSDNQYNVLDWKEINPEIVQFIESDKSGGLVMIGVLYIVIGFGIFGTIIMMVAERKRELGVMISIGMQRMRLYTILFYETILIGIIGVVAGFLVSVPVIFLFRKNPIKLPPELAETYAQYGFEPYFFFGTTPSVFMNQIFIVFLITLMISLYPILKVRKLKITEALRS